MWFKKKISELPEEKKEKSEPKHELTILRESMKCPNCGSWGTFFHFKFCNMNWKEKCGILCPNPDCVVVLFNAKETSNPVAPSEEKHGTVE